MLALKSFQCSRIVYYKCHTYNETKIRILVVEHQFKNSLNHVISEPSFTYHLTLEITNY